jgi:hypothetical protein
MNKKIIFVLVYNEWDGGNSGVFTENVIASLSKETIEAYKKNLEDKSVTIRDKLAAWEEEKNNKLKPLWKELHPIIQLLRHSNAIKMDTDKRIKLIAERRRLTEATGAINQEYYKKKDDFLNSIGIEYYIDDPDTTSFSIDELEVI